MTMRFSAGRHCWLAIALAAMSAAPALGQQTHNANGRHYIYDQFVPPGVAGHMQMAAGNLRPTIPQHVKIRLPEAGTVTFFDGALNRPVSTPAPAQATLVVGQMYRFQISGLANYPHTSFYPSVELIGELHPPPGEAARFPIEIEILEEELRWVSRGQMVTKVVYLEQADRVPLQNLSGAPRVIDVEQGQNAVAEADSLGRPVAIVRIGGRLPDPNAPDPQFWGPLAPVQIVTPPEAAPTQAQVRAPKSGMGTVAIPGRTRTKIFPASATTTELP